MNRCDLSSRYAGFYLPELLRKRFGQIVRDQNEIRRGLELIERMDRLREYRIGICDALIERPFGAHVKIGNLREGRRHVALQEVGLTRRHRHGRRGGPRQRNV